MLWQKKRKFGTCVKQAIDKRKWVQCCGKEMTLVTTLLIPCMFKITHLTSYKICDILNSTWFFI